MAKTLTIKHNEKAYTLEFTRATVAAMERQGFVAEDVEKKPATLLPALFAGAFMANHRTIKREKIDAIYERLSNKSELIQKLVEMYNEPIAALLDEPEEGKEGNTTWAADWE